MSHRHRTLVLISALLVAAATANGQAARSATSRRRAASSLIEAGDAAMDANRPARAAQLYERALERQRHAGNLAAMETTFVLIGLARRENNQSDSAIASYQAGLALTTPARPGALRATLLNNLGSEYRAIGRYDLAYASHVDAARMAGTDWSVLSDALNNIGLVFDDLGMPARTPAHLIALDSALIYYGRARDAAPTDSPLRDDATTLNNMGVVHRRRFLLTGDTAELHAARALYDAAARGARHDSAFALGAQVLQNQALLEGDAGDTTRADSLLGVARLASDSSGQTFWAAMALSERGRIQRRTDVAGLRRAVAFLDTAVALFEQVSGKSGGDATRISFADQQHLIDATNTWILTRLALARADPAPAQAFAMLAAMERGRAGALDVLLRKLPAHPGTVPIGVARSRAAGRANIVSDATLALGGRDLVEGALRTGAAVVSYLVTADTLVIWAAGRDRIPVMVTRRIPRETLTSHVTSLRRMLRVDNADSSARVVRDAVGTATAPTVESALRGVEDEPDLDAVVADSVYPDSIRALADDLLPKEVRAILPDSGVVIIVPNGPLALVPFAALIGGEVRAEARRGIAVRLVPSLTTLALLDRRGRRADPRQLGATTLVVGNPVTPTFEDARGKRRAFRTLGGAAGEAHTIAAMFSSRLLVGAGATEDSVRRLLPSARIVHLATHGYAYADEARAGDSFIALAPGGRGDGLLSAREVSELPPLSADLVVLSACQTALGTIKQAEGIVGLQRAFLGRGARSVVVSLWSVADDATGPFMTSFYRHWRDDADHPSKSMALWRAQVDLRTDSLHPAWKHPRYWAAFQIVGAD